MPPTMRASQSMRLLHAALKTPSFKTRPRALPLLASAPAHRHFRTCTALQGIKTHVLSDIGEGVKEVQIIQWFVEEGASVEEWAPLCEVQSDKASVEITSRYTGVIKKLHFDRDAIVQVGDGMLDIEVDGENSEDESRKPAESGKMEEQEEAMAEDDATIQQHEQDTESRPPKTATPEPKSSSEPPSKPSAPEKTGEKSQENSSLATPAVRGLLKEHGVDISEITGSGKGGRVLKEDVFKYVEAKQEAKQHAQQTAFQPSKPELDAKQVETTQNLTAIQTAMFKSMTKSLSIPHFLFSDKVNVTGLSTMRSRLNAARNAETTPKYTLLPFIIKAVSMSLNHYPLINGRLDISDSNKPKIILRSGHNIGVAMDTPNGLLVPVIKNVNARSVNSIVQELQRLGQLGQAGKLSNSDLSGGTITVSNIGSIGGEAVAPVIVEGQLAIMGIGKVKPTPVFVADSKTVERADLMSTSWSADHRVIDGATMAKMARVVQKYLEEPESMLVDMS